MAPRMMDPFQLQQRLWPHYRFFDKQREIAYSVEENVETHVPACNKVGKDFDASFIAVNTFIRARLAGYTCRIITTSVKDDHLTVLWAEIDRHIQQSVVQLDVEFGGPLILNHRFIRWGVPGQECKISYLWGLVSKGAEGMSGHHAEVTLIIGDEASGLDDATHSAVQGWAKRFLYIGNPNPCDNFWRKAIEAGDLVA